MAHPKQKQTRCVLEPVLENYTGPQNFETKPKPAPKSTKGTKGSSVSFLGRLRDKYVKVMNEMAVGGDLAGVGGFYGCSPCPEYESITQRQKTDQQVREMEALRREMLMLQKGQGTQTTIAA